MRHNFDEIINRRVSECKKYEAACYPEDVLPMWIADTDFAVPAEISEAIQPIVTLEEANEGEETPEGTASL